MTNNQSINNFPKLATKNQNNTNTQLFAETGYDIAKKEKKIQIQLKQRKVAKEKRA